MIENQSVDLEVALKFVNNILKAKQGKELRLPEITVFRGTWQGMTYEQMANFSSYSANYLMRDIAPKFWKSLSEALDIEIGKNNLRLVIEQLYVSSPVESVTSSPLVTNYQTQREQVKDWGNAPLLPSLFYGRDSELAIFRQWLLKDRCQLLGLWGLSGTGKTLLMKKLAVEIEEQYEVIIWRSLDRSPRLTELLKDLLYSAFGILERNPHKFLPELIVQLKSRSCLILLDGIEAILKPQVFSGRYLEGYENYGEFFRLVGESSHQSCVLFTSLEHPGQLLPAGGNESPIRHYNLTGLKSENAISWLKKEKITSEASARYLITYYQGNPAILLTVAQIIRDLFNGNVEEFLAQKSLVFGDINQYMEKSFNRLSALETEILYWLASETKPMSLLEIQNEIPLSVYPVELIEALASLNQRSLITTSQIEQKSVFRLSPAIQEFITNQFVNQIGNKFSVANRQNLLLSDNTIELDQKNHQPTHLSNWLQNRFEIGWQPIEALFANSSQSSTRLRSAFSLRGNDVIKRFKQVNLGTDPSVTVLLLIAISQEDSALKICVQVQPSLTEKILPPNLELNLQDSTNTTLATITSEVQDNFIQLPYFRGTSTEQFQISLNLDSASYQENFMI